MIIMIDVMIDVIILILIQLPKCVSLMQLICLSANSLIILAHLAATISSMYLYLYLCLNLYSYSYLYLICICICNSLIILAHFTATILSIIYTNISISINTSISVSIIRLQAAKSHLSCISISLCLVNLI